MHFSLPLIISLLPLLSNGYVLKKTYKGKSLLNGFNFGSGGSQNGGIANCKSSLSSILSYLLIIDLI